ncbi:MAG: hypothetical protein ACPGWR_26020 [Ardenticatenaceae bacterium]
MTTVNLTANFSPNPVLSKAQKQELAEAFLAACSCSSHSARHQPELADTLLAACSYSPTTASSTRRQPELVVSYLKFSHHPSHLIPTGIGTAFIPNYPQKNGLDMSQLVQVAQDAHGVPYTIQTQPYYRQQYNPLIDQITTTVLEYPTLLPSDQTNTNAPRWMLEHNIFGYFVLNPFTESLDPLGHHAFVKKATQNEPKYSLSRFDSNGRPRLQKSQDGWQVKSQSDPQTTHKITFTVNPPHGVAYYCDCKGAIYRRKCWHMEQARKLGESDKRVQQALEEVQAVNDLSWPEDSGWG